MFFQMGLVNLLFPCPRSPSINEHEYEKSERNLMNLTPEILLAITEYLSPADNASLILCSHALLWVLGNRSWSSLRPGKEHEAYRELFLTTLTRDLSRHFSCHHCSRLHLCKDIGPPGPALQPKNSLLCVQKQLGPGWPSVQVHSSLSRYRFSFPHLQLAIKRYHHGPGYGISTQTLAFTEVEMSGNEDDADQLTTLLSVEARICPEPMSLCLRIQQWALISSARREMILSQTKSVMICDHLTARSSEISRVIEAKLKDWRPAGSNCGVHPNLLKCQHCNTDFRVEIKKLDDKGLALVITKWLDLGSGLTPRDIRWRVYLRRLSAAEIGRLGEAGDIRLRFESEPGLSEDSLSCQNALYLIGNRFKKEMDVWDSKLWILQAGKRLPVDYSDRAFFFALVVSDLALVWFVWEIFFRTK